MYGLSPSRGLLLATYRSARGLYLNQRYPGCRTSMCVTGMNQRWRPRFQEKPQSTTMTRPYHSHTDSAHVNRVIALELTRRGDFRDVGDISDMEFNELYLEAFPEAMLDQETDPVFLKPEMYDPQSSSWVPSGNEAKAPERGDVIKVASWKRSLSAPNLTAVRTSAAIAHLRAIFGQKPHSLVVMLQDVRQKSLNVILNDKWIQQNFILSDTELPYEVDEFDEEEEEVDLGSSQDFNMMMISRNLPVANCFRVPFLSEIHRDTLVVDIPVSVSEDHDPDVSKRSFRLCTTETELCYDQLVSVSELLKGELSQGQKIIGGLVGGDMSGRDIHRDPRIGLKDVWEDEPSPVPPTSKSSRKDAMSGKAKGNRWGSHSEKTRTRKQKRLGRFLYTGSMETVALNELQDTVGNMGRFGKGVKTKSGSDDVSDSDHVGITVSIKIV